VTSFGLKIREIGAKRRISESTVKTHIASVYTKLKINTKEELFEHIIQYQTARFGYETSIF
jgi:DNA-binding NarL/FixJ family response regulator